MAPLSKATGPEFWGVEVKSGKTVRVFPKEGESIHIAQATFDEEPEDRSPGLIHLMLKVNDSTFIMGSLSAENIHHMPCHLVIERPFELSHNWKNGSVHFYGHTVEYLVDDDDDDGDDDETGSEDSEDSDDSDEEDKPSKTGGEVKSDGKGGNPKSSTKSKVEANKKGSSESAVKKPLSIEKAKPESSQKKRPSESPSKNPVPVKKARLEAPQKTDGKKGSGQVGEAPQPSKPKTDAKSEELSSKAAGTSNSDGALKSPSKVKHGLK